MDRSQMFTENQKRQKAEKARALYEKERHSVAMGAAMNRWWDGLSASEQATEITLSLLIGGKRFRRLDKRHNIQSSEFQGNAAE